ncbi:mitochondrial ribosomal protein S22 [Lycorma delicatula]|uniref:mitochondrial ribosomal protein S22 n=1 Tax=Lycorma delicatula TaxID=130591 RepID=UPI003F50E96C
MLKFSRLINQCRLINGPQLKVNFDLSFRSQFNEPVKAINEEIKKQFYEPEVQKLLKQLTRVNFEKVFRRRKLGKKLKAPTYKFMTTQQIEEQLKDAEKRAEEKMQMPPVLPPRKEINEVLSVDKELTGLWEPHVNYVFTDISFAKTDVNRVIVVREPNGTLRKAYWNERERINQIYFPVPGRKLIPHKVFKPENLLDLCERHEYEFILDLACLQFEPNDADYLRVTVTVYDHVNETQCFELLRSTRHYGPLIFHIASQRDIDNLIIENLRTARLEDAVWAITLLHLLKPESKSAKTTYKPGDELAFIKSYIELDSNKRGVLEMTYKAYIDTHENLPGLQQQSN